MFKRLLIFILILHLLFVIEISAQKQEADLIIINAKVRTMDNKMKEASAVAMKDGKIIAVEKNDRKVQKYVGTRTKRIDARGKLVLPGFNDSHVHFMGIGNIFSSIDLKDVRDPNEIVEKIRFYLRFIPKGRWILGGGWNNQLWDSKDLPTRQLLDDITYDNPVFLYSADGTMALANSKALKLARIDKNKSDVTGGEFVRNAKGELTGILKGNAMQYVKLITPQTTTKQLAEVAETATNYAAYMGVTSVQDMHSDYISDFFGELQRQGKLKNRIYDCTPLSEWKKLADQGIRRANGSEMIRTGCLKSFADGDIESDEQLYDYISEADKAGLQVMIHAIGSRPNNNILSIFERVATTNGAKDRRFRVEHAYGVNPSDIERFGKSNTIASIQPYLFGGNYPYRSMMRSNAPIAFGSDASITDFNPLYSIYSAVNNSGDNISVEDAVQFYTVGSAYAEFQEDIKGSISVGKLADIVILSDDIFSIKSDKIKDATVYMTILDGKIVYNVREFTTVPSPNVRP